VHEKGRFRIGSPAGALRTVLSGDEKGGGTPVGSVLFHRLKGRGPHRNEKVGGQG